MCVFLFTFILEFGIWKNFPPRWHFHILPLKVCLILLVARRRIVLFSRGRHLFWFGTFLNSSTALLFLFITSLFLSFDNFIFGVTVLVFVYFLREAYVWLFWGAWILISYSYCTCKSLMSFLICYQLSRYIFLLVILKIVQMC